MRTISVEDIYESTAQLSIYITTQHYTDPLYTDQYKDQHKSLYGETENAPTRFSKHL